MSEWQPIETCGELRLVLTYADWDSPHYRVGSFEWHSRSEWDVTNETSDPSGARRQIRQETVRRYRLWDNGAEDGYNHWMPLPAPPDHQGEAPDV
jgi:hypothetical protein